MAENKTTPVKKQIDVSLADLSNAGGMLAMATTVTDFIKNNNLSTNIQGKSFVNVEGWQFAGGMIGVLPIVQSTENLSSAEEIKYRASVELINIKTGQKVGAGIATCSNKESGKKFFAEYAIESMAQTRAVGKAYRLMLGWLMKAAGYEATPAEEMDFATAEVVEQPKKAEPAKAPQPTIIIKSEAEDVPPPAPDAKTAFIASHHESEHADVAHSLESDEQKPATSQQKEELIRLLTNPVILKDEKTKMLLNINKLTTARAAESIVKLNQTINERETQKAA